MRRVTRAIESARTQSVPKRRNWRRSERILVAVNLTEEGGELVTWALTHGSRSGDAVTVIYVVEPCPPSATRAKVTRWERQKKDMLNILSKVVTHCRTHYEVPHLSIVVQVVENHSVGDAIVKEARSLEATRVILGKHRSRRLDISLKRMTSLGNLCVQSLEPHCEVCIVRKGKVLIRKHGTAKTRRSLEAFLFSNKAQESSTDSEEADSPERQEGISQMDDSPLAQKKSWFFSTSSSFGKSSRSSNSSGTFSIIDSSRDSFSPGGSETSPRSVLKIFNKDSKSLPGTLQEGDDETREKIDGQRLLLRSTTFPASQVSQAESWLKAAASTTHSRSRSSSNSLESVLELSLESVPEIPEQIAEELKFQDEGALVVFNPPQLEKRKEVPEEELAIVCVSQPEEESEDSRKIGEYLDALVCFIAPEPENVNENEERALVLLEPPQLDVKKEARLEVFDRESEEAGAIVLSSFFPRELEDREGEENAIVLHQSSPDDFRWPGFSPLALKDRKEEDGSEEVRSGCCSPPKFARTCSAVKYDLSEDGLQSLSKDVIQELPEVQRFSYAELRLATDDFSPKNVVGTGGASSVYKGQLTDGRWMAIKKLVDDSAGETEFMMEMMMLVCTLNHPNLVTMLGFCAEGPHHLIAYKLLSRGSLERNLHSLKISRKLNWEQRQKVAFGASRGVAYLHNFRPKPIVHRDIKTSNILLADDFEAQISDFGLARWVSEADTAVFDEQVSCAGTFGYLAPECLMYGGFNERTDVFAFGVVLLELISGRRPMDESLQDTSLVLWARTLQQNGRTHCLVDKSLKDINPQQFKRMMYTAFLCVQVSPEDRPTMDRVVRLLDPDCNYSPAILQPNISAPPFMSMPEFGAERQQSPSPPSSPSYGQQPSSPPSSPSTSSSLSPSSQLQLALPFSPPSSPSYCQQPSAPPSSPSTSSSSSPSSQLQLALPFSPPSSPSYGQQPSASPSSPSTSSSSSPSSQLQLALPSSAVQ